MHKDSIIKQKELELEKKLELIKIDSTYKAEEKLKFLGTIVNEFIYIIDPYLYDPNFIHNQAVDFLNF